MPRTVVASRNCDDSNCLTEIRCDPPGYQMSCDRFGTNIRYRHHTSGHRENRSIIGGNGPTMSTFMRVAQKMFDSILRLRMKTEFSLIAFGQ